MKKINLIILFLILSLFVFTGCGIKAKGSDIYGNYNVGKEGLNLKFLTQAPPSIIYDEEQFEIQVVLENKGAYSLNNKTAASIKFIHDPFPFIALDIETKNLLQQIEGKSYTYPTGDFLNLLIAKAKSNELAGNFEKTKTDFYLNMCYPYKTFFVDQVCVDTDIRKEGLRKQVCTAENLFYNDGQGAPVAVVSIEPKMIPYGNYVEPQFKITIQNVGTGNVKEPVYQKEGTYDITCSDNAKLNVVNIDAKLQGETLVCLPQNITLKGGTGTATCRFAKDSITMTSSNFYTVLEINLEYNYEEMYSKQTTIARKTDLAFANVNRYLDRCQGWEVEENGECISLCEYCARPIPGEHAARCYFTDKEKDQTTFKENFLCLYSYEMCSDANKYVERKDLENNCITREGSCPPSTYCGAPMCVLEGNNNIPKSNADELQSTSASKITWRVIDIDDQVTTEGNLLFGNKNKYPDMARTCGTEINKITKVPISYYAFVNKLDACEVQVYFETASIYGYTETLYPPVFEEDIPTNSEGNLYTYVCIKAKDKQGLESIKKYEIKTSSGNTRLE